MAKTKNVKKKNYKKGNKNKQLVLSAFVLSLFIIICTWQFIANYQHKQEIKNAYQAQITRNTNNAGVELDKIEAELKNSGIVGKTERTNYCYHASREWEEGPIYCTQKLDIIADYASDVQILSDFAVISNLMGRTVLLNYVKNSEIGSYDEKNRIYKYFGKNQSPNQIGCSVIFYGNNSMFGNYSTNNHYEINVDCTSGDFDKPIYPLKD